MKKYKHLFFDLDRTLWDFEQNSTETITELFHKLGLADRLNTEAHFFVKVYKEINGKCWELYRKGIIDKNQLRLKRFYDSLSYYGLEDEKFALQFNDDYVNNCSIKTNLIPHSIEVLDYLKPKYQMHIITNGFVEAQYVKLEKSGLAPYFKEVVVSDGFGYRKPDPRIFHHALNLADASAENSLMIGDDYGPDVIGAKAVSMDQVFFSNNAEKKEATYCIQSLRELKGIL